MRIKQAMLLRLRPGDILVVRVPNLTKKMLATIQDNLGPKLAALQLDPPITLLVCNKNIDLSIQRPTPAESQ